MPRPRSMVGTLRLRVLALVAAAVVAVGAAGLWGLRIITDLVAERELAIASQAVGSWGGSDGSRTSISADRLKALDPTATVVALVDGTRVVTVAADPGRTPVAPLEELAGALTPGETRAVEIAGRSLVVTTVAFPAGTVYASEQGESAVTGAIVGIATGAADRLLRAMTLFAFAVLAVILLAAALAVTRIVTRTTSSLTVLAGRVRSGDLAGLSTPPLGDYAETQDIASAIADLDDRRTRTEQRLRDFVADASHELRTPLTKIQGWSELHFQDPGDTARVDRAFGSIVEESERMRALVDQLTQLARAENEVPVEHSAFDLAELAAAVVDDAALLADRTPIGFHSNGRTLVEGSAQEVTQLLRNLIGNAVVHGGEEARVEVSVDGADGRVVLVVADDGRGIAPALQGRVFDRFVTGDGGRGTGLGLAIVQAIAVAHHAAVELTSAQGEGTRVTVSFPAAPPDAEPATTPA